MSEFLAESDHGHGGQPGSQYDDKFAGVRAIKHGRYELLVRSSWGSNQGYLEEHGRIERRYRADNLDELMRVGIAEVRSDSEFDDDSTSKLVAAIRDAVFDAEDAEPDGD